MRISLTLLFVAAWNICCLPLGCAKYSIPELDDEFQESIAELISNDAESSLDTISQVIQFKKVLKQLIGMPDTSVSDNIKDSVQQTDISMEGNTVIEEAIKIPCHKHFGCADCVSNLCAWCIAQRVCKDDAAWQCLGQHDHVGLGGIGNHMKCPSLESMNQQRQARRKRKEEAKKETALNLIQKPIINTSKTSSVNADNNNRESTQQQSQEEKLIELKRRATLAEDNYGATHPYETLGVDLTASGGEIRKIYRKLSLLYHPDKNQGDEEVTSLADAAFKDIVAAFDILGGQ